MLVPPLPEDYMVGDWHDRHTHPVSLALHILGIPFLVLSIVLVPLYLTLFSLSLFLLAVCAFLLSYVLQFLGHACDHTEPGEITHLRRWYYRPRRNSPGNVADEQAAGSPA